MSRLLRVAAPALVGAALLLAPLAPAGAVTPGAAPAAQPAASASRSMLLTQAETAAALAGTIKARSLTKVGSPTSTGVGWYQSYKARTPAGVPMSVVVETDAMPRGVTFTTAMKRWATANKATAIRANQNAWFGYVNDTRNNRALYVTFANKGNRAWLGEAFVGVPLSSNKAALEAAAEASLSLAAAQQKKNSTPQG